MRRFWIACAAIVLVGLVLRLVGLGERMLCHPENFAPGLDLPSWVRFPPPRHDMVSVLRGTLIDGHPPTYFVALLGWVELFGASLTSLRLPSALLGALSIALVAAIGLREGRKTVALLAAALLALHGHHVYWSQMARMYVPAAFLALLSTWFLLRLVERGRARDLWGFFASTVLALWMQLYAWPLVFAQMIAGVLLAARDGRAPQVLRAQLFAVIASLPVVQLSIYQDPPSRWHEPASEYLELGYLFWSRAPFLHEDPALAWSGPLLLVAGVALLAAAVRRGRSPEVVGHAPSVASLPHWFELAVVAGSTLVLVAFAKFAPARPRVDSNVLWALCAMPALLAVAAPFVERWISRATTSRTGWIARLAALDVPVSWWLALVPFACMAAVSSARGAFVARGTIVFLPFLALALAHGLATLSRGLKTPAYVGWLGWSAIAGVLGLHVASLSYFANAESSPRDYRGLAEQLCAELGPGDRVLVKNDFSSPPLIYYLREHEPQLVYRDYVASLGALPEVSRVWIPRAEGHETPEAMLAAVAGFAPVRTLRAHEIEATLYERH